MKTLESYLDDLEKAGMTKEIERGLISYHLPPEMGEGFMKIAGDTDACYASWGDVTLKKDLVNTEAGNERYLGFSIYILGDVKYYNQRNDTIALEHGMNFYVHFPSVFRYMRIKAGERFICGGMIFRESFIESLGVPSDFWEVAADVLNPSPLTDLPQIFELWEQVKNCNLKGEVLEIYIKGKGLEIFALMLDYIYKQNRKSKMHLSEHDYVALSHAKMILLENMENPPTIKELSKQIGVNQQKLMTGFKQTTGCTVYGYLKQIRMGKAFELLRDTDLSIVRIARKVGYHGDGHFQKAFASVFGQTPSAMRKGLRP